ncbi:hypothetical protein LRP67_08850 [Nocardioides sp. cx-169]|uniref:hypothetical protein n=1 Tax=Nocardioides sp. cx-169 TaxID=2899080 RepID=UPI001E4F4C21|nr:hypothetical protein [Nocardioides sp. cx-169]MCD4534187.1 hypothetical protein [Nocardioides sp. cx-169]
MPHAGARETSRAIPRAGGLGAGGGSGSFAIQLAKRAGAHVTGVDNAGKLDFMRSVEQVPQALARVGEGLALGKVVTSQP